MKNIQALVQALKSDFEPLSPDPILASFLFGQCLGEGFVPKKQPAKAGLVLSNSRPGHLKRLTSCVKKYSKLNVSFPYLFTVDFIQTSLDSFPLEFLELKQRHMTVTGEDVLAGLEIKKEDIRLQCERELKGKGMHLNAALLNLSSDKELAGLIKLSSEDFNRIYLGLLCLIGKQGPHDPCLTVEVVAKHFGLDNTLLMNITQGNVPKKDVRSFCEQYIEQITKLSTIVDRGDL
jgi:hypothetical protein